MDIEDAELGTRRVVDSGLRRVREAYARAADDRRAAFRQWCANVGIAGFDIPTAADPIGPLTRIFHGRAAARGQS